MTITALAPKVLTRDLPLTAGDAAGDVFGALIGDGESFMIEEGNLIDADGHLRVRVRGSWFALVIETDPVDEMVIAALRAHVLSAMTSEDPEAKLTEGVSVFSELDSDTIFFFEPNSSTRLMLTAL